MRISIGCDHGGYNLKEQVVKYLESKLENKQEIEVVDYGCYGLDSCDYPVFAKKVANDVSNGESTFGILICTTGIGMSITANKFKNVRAALVTNIESAHLTRMHNNSNVICLGAKFTPYEEAIAYIEAFITEQFEGGRHQRRVSLIEE